MLSNVDATRCHRDRAFRTMPLQRLIATLRADLHPGTERSRLVRSAGATVALKVGSTLLAFGASLLYARVLGPHDYGLYAYVVACTGVLAIPASLGLPQYFIREGAKHPQSLSWLRRWGDKRLLATGLAAAGLLACAALIPETAGARWLFVIASPLPLLTNLSAIRVSLLQTQRRIARSQWPRLLLAPGLMLAALLGLWASTGHLSALEMILLLVATSTVPAIFNEFQLRRLPTFRRSSQPTNIRTRQALPFMWLGMLDLVNSRTDLLMLGASKGAHAAGIYAVAARAAGLVPFLLIAANTVIAPTIAQLYREGDTILLQRLISGATFRVFLLTLPVALVAVVFSKALLEYVYGPAYVPAAFALQILTAAQLFNVLAGPTGMLLTMTGHEKLTANGIGISAVVNIALNAFLIPYFSVAGAAMATGLSLLLCNILLWQSVRKHLHVRPSALSL